MSAEPVITLDELRARLDDPELVVVDVRTAGEFAGSAGDPNDPRQGHIPGARNVDVSRLFAGGGPLPPEELRALVGAPEGAELAVYCHSGARSALAAALLRTAGYDARNYRGSWQEWSRHPDLPAE